MTNVDRSPAIELDAISVRYRVPRERLHSFKEYAIHWLQRRLEYVDFWALHQVGFQVQRGEAFGVVGVNGAGKSTLLKTVARVLHPTRGRVLVRGTVAPMLELGAGFHNELTGRENVFLYGTLLGFTRHEIEAAFDGILEFSEVDDFIDAPLRTYSTGMVGRLGFAVATAKFADIFLVDEVLSVGDVGFQKKCLDRIESYRQRGATILFVSHALGTVAEICQRAAWLEQGKLKMIGAADEVITAFSESVYADGI